MKKIYVSIAVVLISIFFVGSAVGQGCCSSALRPDAPSYLPPIFPYERNESNTASQDPDVIFPPVDQLPTGYRVNIGNTCNSFGCGRY